MFCNSFQCFKREILFVFSLSLFQGFDVGNRHVVDHAAVIIDIVLFCLKITEEPEEVAGTADTEPEGRDDTDDADDEEVF